MIETVKTRTIKIGGREFELAFTLKGMLAMRKNIEGFDFNKLDEHISDPEDMVAILYILAENGAALQEKKLDVDQEWFEIHIPTAQRKIMEIQLAINETMADGMMMETEVDEERGKVIDVVLQQIQKKRKRTSSPGDK